MSTQPIYLGIAGANDIVSAGLRTLLESSEVVVLDTFPAYDAVPDVVLYDVIGLQEDDGVELDRLIKEHESAVIVVARDLRPDLAARALAHGAAASFSIEADAEEILGLIRAAAAGDLGDEDGDGDPPEYAVLGGEAGLSRREVDVLTGITKGMSNEEIASIHFLSLNTIKSIIRSAYRKIGVTRRSQAVAWCLQHGFEPPPDTDLQTL